MLVLERFRQRVRSMVEQSLEHLYLPVLELLVVGQSLEHLSPPVLERLVVGQSLEHP
jgi:hypothetical protein